MRVLQLISSAGNYGAENVVLNLSRALRDAGTFSTLAVFHNIHRPNLDFADSARREGHEVVVLPCVGRIDHNAVQALRDLVLGRDLQLVHSHGYKAHAYAYCALKSNKANKAAGSGSKPFALVATCHGHHSSQQTMGAEIRRKVYAAAEVIMLRRFDRVVAVSDTLAESLWQARISRQRISIIGNGIDLTRFEKATPAPDLVTAKSGRVAIGLVGRLIAGKGHEIALQAMQRLIRRYPELLLVVVGDGPLRRPLELQAESMSLGSNVLFTGKRNDMPAVYAALDISILPSLAEGMPMAVLESMAARKPVIATNVGAIPEVVQHQRTGLLIRTAEVDDLANAIEQILRDVTLSTGLAEAGFHLVRSRFGAGDMAGKYLNLYREALC